MNIGTVVSNYELADTTVSPAKRHMDVRLPEGSSYTARDYLVVQACNPDETVRHALILFGMHEHAMMRVKGSKKNFFRLNQPLFTIFCLIQWSWQYQSRSGNWAHWSATQRQVVLSVRAFKQCKRSRSTRNFWRSATLSSISLKSTLT